MKEAGRSDHKKPVLETKTRASISGINIYKTKYKGTAHLSYRSKFNPEQVSLSKTLSHWLAPPVIHLV